MRSPRAPVSACPRKPRPSPSQRLSTEAGKRAHRSSGMGTARLPAPPEPGVIHYGRGGDAWSTWSTTVRNLASRPEIVRVCDVGGGAQPALSVEEIGAWQLDYVLADLSEHELTKASPA